MNKTLIIAFMILTQYFVNAQQTDFEIIMDTDYDEVPTIFKIDDTGNFVGLVRKAPPTDSVYIYNSFLYKIEPDGDTTSIMFHKEDTNFFFHNLERLNTEPKGFILIGYGYKYNESPNHPFTIFMRVDDDFNILWEKIYRFNYYYGGYTSKVMELTNGDIVYACAPELSSNMLIFKLSSAGDSLNYMAYSGNDAGEVWGLSYNYDSTAILVHTQWAHYVTGDNLCSIITLNNNLEQVNVQFYPEHHDTPYNAMPFENDQLLTGISEFIGHHTGEIERMISAYVLDSSLNVVHEVHLTNPDTNSSAAQTQCIDYYYDNCIYLGGNHNLQGLIGQQPNWFYVSKLNDTLGVEYEKYIGGDDYYVLFSVTAASDGGVLLAGTKQEVALTYFQRDGIIIKLDSVGCVTNVSDKKITISDAIVYPNPGSSFINIRTALDNCKFKLFNNMGQSVINKTVSGLETKINVNKLKKGNYFYSVTRNNKTVISGAWIKN